jgi:hypothetical protein
MSDEKPVTDQERITAYVRIVRIVCGIDDDQHGLGEIDNPPTVVETLEGAMVRRGFRPLPCRATMRSSSISSAPSRRLQAEESWHGRRDPGFVAFHTAARKAPRRGGLEP